MYLMYLITLMNGMCLDAEITYTIKMYLSNKTT